MDKSKSSIALLITLLTVVVAACGRNSAPPGKNRHRADTEWRYERVIAKPLHAAAGSAAVDLGDLNSDAVNLKLPRQALRKGTKITLATPKKVPKYFGREIKPLGAPVELSGGSVKRLDGKAIVTMKFDPASFKGGNDKSFLRVVYFDGKQWEYLKPAAVDFKAGLATFETYHFSLIGLAKVKDETKLTEAWIHSQALDSELRKHINNKADFVVKQIIEMTLDKMGVNDKTTTHKVVTHLLTSDGDTLREMYEAAKKGRGEAAFQKFSVYMGTLISRNIPKSAVKEAMDKVTGGADDIAAVSKALGYAAGGRYKDAAKIIGENISDKFLITTAGKIAVETVDYQINSWKNSEVEAAYKAYKNGADGKFWGYNVDAGDFDGVWSQMRGISRQLELEAVKKEQRIRRESGMPPLSDRRAAVIRQSVKESFRSQFKERLKHEKAIEKEEAKLKPLIDAYRKANLLSDNLGPVGLDKGFSYEQKLNLLYKFANKMMRDTGRPDYKDLKGIRPRKALLISDIVIGARIYFGKNGKKRYLAYLEKVFGQGDKNLPKLKLSIEREGYFGGNYLKIPIVINNKSAGSILPANITITRKYDMQKLNGSSGRNPELVEEKSEFHGSYNLKTGILTGALTYHADIKFIANGGKVGAVATYTESGQVRAELNKSTGMVEGKLINGKAKSHREILIANDQGFKPEPSDDAWAKEFKVYGKLPKGL